jgi:hypothetical protein
MTHRLDIQDAIFERALWAPFFIGGKNGKNPVPDDHFFQWISVIAPMRRGN